MIELNEIGRNPVSVSTRFSQSMEMSRLTRDGDREIFSFIVKPTTSRIIGTRLVHTLAIFDRLVEFSHNKLTSTNKKIYLVYVMTYATIHT